MAETEAYRTGNDIRRELMGEATIERMKQTVYTDDIMAKFGAYATEAVFGMLWSRPGLDLKTRTLICVVSDTVMGRPDELKIHLRMALRQGWTEDELAEAIMHIAGYAGLPLVREALLTARETFQEVRAEA